MPLRKAPQGGASSGTSSQARAQSSAGMAELGRRKGKAPVVTKAWNRGKVGIRNRKLRAICAFSNTQTVRFRYRDISANWRRRGRRGAAAIYEAVGRHLAARTGIRLRGMVRFLRRRGHGQGKALTLGGVAETFVALNRGPRVQAMEI